MLSKNEIKKLVKYKQDKYRKQDEIYIVEGVKLCKELLDSDIYILSIYAIETWIEENAKLLEVKALMPLVREITQEELEKISHLTTPNQVYCLCRRTPCQLTTTPKGLTLVLDGIKDPGNLGTIIRIADWYAIENIICSQDCVDVYNPKTVQSTMGSIFRVKVSYQNLEEFFASLPKSYPIYGTIVEGGKSIYETSLSKDSILIIGSESHGISEAVRKHITHKITIPRGKPGNKPESLNAAIATAICVSAFYQSMN
jgi:TrmH family RNA methyltransferase